MRGRAIKRNRRRRRDLPYEPEWPGGKAPLWALIVRFVAWGIVAIIGGVLLFVAFGDIMRAMKM